MSVKAINELKEWLDENAHTLLSEWVDEEPEESLPEGWSLNEKAVAHYGGEDQGSEYWTVWEFNKTNGASVLVRVNGWYQSYAGSEYNDWDEVVPATETVTVYKEA